MPETTTQTDDASERSSATSPPPPPDPSSDPSLQYIPSPESDVTSPRLIAEVDDIFKVTPAAALRLLSIGIEALVEATGDVPPTPPPRSPTIPHLRGFEAEKQSIVRSNSEKNLARLMQQSKSQSPRSGLSRQPSPQPPTERCPDPEPQSQQIDGVHLRTPNPTPPPASDPHQRPPLEPYIIVGENSQPLNLQHSAIARKFYSRLPPPISITDYLLRIHRFCPMSTAVYIATSLYIHRLAVLERAILVTRRNAHRLVLGGLRVAMKALEDSSYSHGKFARVGGVREAELARLEISFCFLTSFELMVTEESLRDQWELLRRGRESWELKDHGQSQGVIELRLPRAPITSVP